MLLIPFLAQGYRSAFCALATLGSEKIHRKIVIGRCKRNAQPTVLVAKGAALSAAANCRND
jgi:hypothetical protein